MSDRTIITIVAIILIGFAIAFAWPSYASRGRAPATAPIGMVPSTPDGSGDVLAMIDQARDLGFDPLYWYVRPDEIPSDVIVRKLGERGRVAINLSIVSTTVLGRYRPPWKSFTDPGFAEAFAADVAKFADTHEPEWLCVGNEANTYLRSHPGEIVAFEAVLRAVRAAVKVASPKTRFCVSLSFRDSEKDQHVIAKRLAPQVDLVAFTSYGYVDPGFLFLNPADGIAQLDRIEKLPIPYAIAEVSWSSSPPLLASEASQADFATWLRARKSSAEFVAWFYLQDGQDCTPRARMFIPPGQTPSKAQLDTFSEFLCRLGLVRKDGTAKPAAEAFK